MLETCASSDEGAQLIRVGPERRARDARVVRPPHQRARTGYAGNREAHRQSVIAMAAHLGLPEATTALDFKAVRQLANGAVQACELPGSSRQPVALFNPQFRGVPNSGSAPREKGCDRQERDLIYQSRY